ncbi:hypothetical protein [Nocardia mexicana]|uniref:Uncharacterized protein n=1 Tax=Nocardia mexicana TaxID=279262 RepID=A0A370GSQ1_9NOCA|nr:hypothetical protein [Nocardia mexicana]RDI46469.1 hypothetical protein DFR68_111228 [Nocardia mexicana]
MTVSTEFSSRVRSSLTTVAIVPDPIVIGMPDHDSVIDGVIVCWLFGNDS